MPENCNPVNKIIIVGHPTSGLGQVESLLLSQGMSSALPSRREAMDPRQITEVLCKRYRTPFLETVAELDIQQITPAKQWDEMILDLEIGNSGQEWWGWADSDCIFLLDYWRALDPEVMFLLVYNTPGDFFNSSDPCREVFDPTSGQNQRFTDNWVAYNSKLLEFSLSHPRRTLLAHSDEIFRNPSNFFAQIQARCDVSLNDHGVGQPKNDGINPAWIGRSLPPELAESKDGSPDEAMLMVPPELVNTLQAARQHRSLVNEAAVRAQIYQELQAVAQISSGNLPLPTCDRSVDWDDLVADSNILSDQFCQLYQALVDQHRLLANKLEECDLLLSQVYQAQEELESYFLKNNLLRAEIKRLRKDNVELTRNRAVKRLKKQLSYRLGSILVSNSSSIGGVIGMPFHLIAETTRFRKRRRLDRQRKGTKKRDKREKTGSKSQGVSAKRNVHAGSDQAAKKIKQQLSYRLGQALVANARSPIGWIRMPFSIIEEIVRFRKRRIRMNDPSKSSHNKVPRKQPQSF